MNFTLQESLKIQAGQLKKWEAVLKPEVYAKLEQTALESNKGKTNPFEIMRGNELDIYIHNELMPK